MSRDRRQCVRHDPVRLKPDTTYCALQIYQNPGGRWIAPDSTAL